MRRIRVGCVFFFNDTATTEIYTLSLHDALPISISSSGVALAPGTRLTNAFTVSPRRSSGTPTTADSRTAGCSASRSEEHTSELQSRQYLVCRLLLEKKKHTPDL